MRIEGLPDARNDFGIAQIMLFLVNALGGSKQPMALGDFMPWTKQPKPEQAEDASTRSEQIMALLGGSQNGR